MERKRGGCVLTSLSGNKNLSKSKSAQVTIFIIIALIIVAAGVLVYIFVPSIRTAIGTRVENPNDFIDTCIKDKLQESVELVSLNGGSIEPEHTVNYLGDEIEYLCYTNKDYTLCSVEQPFIKKHIEEEITENIEEEATECFNALKKSYENKGYDVSLGNVNFKTEVLPERVVVTFNTNLVLTKGEEERYEQFVVFVNNNLYELLGIASSITEWEATLGNVEPTNYMNIYHNIKVERDRLTDGTKVYILTDKTTKDVFRFASRSLAYPSGVGEI